MTYAWLEMGARREAGVPFDVDAAVAVAAQKLDPFVGLDRRLAHGEDLLDQRSVDLERILDGVSVRKTVRSNARNWNVALKLESRHSLADAENQQVLMQENEVTVLMLK